MHATTVVVVLLQELALFLVVDGLLHDDLVHGAPVVAHDLRKDACLVNLGATLESTGSHSHLLDAATLLSVRLRQLLKRHEVDEEVVADLRVSVDALGMGLNDTLSKDTWVLSIEEQVDAGELNVLVSTVPITSEPLRLLDVVMDEDWLPVATAVGVAIETFAWNGHKGAVRLVSIGDPLLRQAAIVLCVVEGLQREPVGVGLDWASVVNTLNKVEFKSDLSILFILAIWLVYGQYD